MMIVILQILILVVLLLGAPLIWGILVTFFAVLGFNIVGFLQWLGWGGGALLVLAMILGAWADVRFDLSGSRNKTRR